MTPKTDRCPYCYMTGCVCDHKWGDSCRCGAERRPDVARIAMLDALLNAPAPSHCAYCNGSGRVGSALINDPCPKCLGTGAPLGTPEPETPEKPLASSCVLLLKDILPPAERERPTPPTPDFTQSFDAREWAAAWCKIANEIEAANDGRKVIDEGWMIGWFANALMRGFDEFGRLRRQPPAAPVAERAPTECPNSRTGKHCGHAQPDGSCCCVCDPLPDPFDEPTHASPEPTLLPTSGGYCTGFGHGAFTGETCPQCQPEPTPMIAPSLDDYAASSLLDVGTEFPRPTPQSAYTEERFTEDLKRIADGYRQMTLNMSESRDELKHENRALKDELAALRRQVETLTEERDKLQANLEHVRAVFFPPTAP